MDIKSQSYVTIFFGHLSAVTSVIVKNVFSNSAKDF